VADRRALPEARAGRRHVSARGPDVLLLHGQPGGAGDWDGVLRRLGDRANGIAVDRPGWDGIRPARGLAGNAEAALAVLDARGVSRAVVAGHSFGAAVAAWLAADHPERVSALVLAAPAANLASLYPLDYWLASRVVGDLVGAGAMAGLGLALAVTPVRRRIAITTGIADAYLGAARRALLTPAGWRAYAAEQRALIRDLPALEQRLAQITAPTTILTGEADTIVPTRAAPELASQIPGARLTVSPGAGHLLPQRHPEVVAQMILAALPVPAR
jgi:pimeloyl-ACP methyl ester carboxylesterase